MVFKFVKKKINYLILQYPKKSDQAAFTNCGTMLSRKGIKIYYPEFYWVFSLKSMYLSKNDVPEVIICNFPRLQWIFVKKRILKNISFKDRQA